MKQLLLVAHAPSGNTLSMVDAIIQGTRLPEIGEVGTLWLPPLEAAVEDVLSADGIILGTTENLGNMSGALKDFFDRIYYPCLEEKQGLACALYVRAGHDGTGTQKAVESICNGLRWNWVEEPLICRGEWKPDFKTQCFELGATMAAGLDAGVF